LIPPWSRKRAVLDAKCDAKLTRSVREAHLSPPIVDLFSRFEVLYQQINRRISQTIRKDDNSTIESRHMRKPIRRHLRQGAYEGQLPRALLDDYLIAQRQAQSHGTRNHALLREVISDPSNGDYTTAGALSLPFLFSRRPADGRRFARWYYDSQNRMINASRPRGMETAANRSCESAMRYVTYRALAFVAWSLIVSTAQAHYNMLLPQAASVKKGEPVTLIYQWGHPFEHQLFDAPAPASLVVRDPGGKMSDLTKALEKVKAVATEGKAVIAYRLRFVPEQRGDYAFFLVTPPIWMEEDKEFFQDTVQVILHVQAQKGWDRKEGPAFKVMPLTRPYGLQPGMVFQAQVVTDHAEPGSGLEHLAPDVFPLRASLVEIERSNPRPPARLPPDEFITRTVRTDPNGVVTCTLLEPGWWCLTAHWLVGQRERDGKRYPLRKRSSLWVFVDPAPAAGVSK
jgi:cobalt/nickel transport protein